MLRRHSLMMVSVMSPRKSILISPTDSTTCTVVKVTTENVQGKMKRNGAYPMGRSASWKKAVVKLSADSKNIEIFEGMA